MIQIQLNLFVRMHHINFRLVTEHLTTEIIITKFIMILNYYHS